MEKDNSRFERAAQVALGDSIDLSPEDRAKHVFNLIKEKAPELTNWDLICFSANYLGMISGAFPWLEVPAKHICKLVYTAHYQDKETNIGTGIRSKTESSNIESNRSQSSKRGNELGIEKSGEIE